MEEYKLDEVLFRLFGKDNGLFLGLASYSSIAENNASQYYPDYAYNHPFMTEDMKVYNDAKISDYNRAKHLFSEYME